MRTIRVVTLWVLIASVVLMLLFGPGFGLADGAPTAAIVFGLFGLAALRQHRTAE
jgi:hypothetical protein